jgi:hypothetical protein
MFGGGGSPAPVTPVSVSPPAARPGDIIRVSHPHGEFKSRHGLDATIGGSPAVILRVPDDNHLDIIVPIVPSDSVDVVVRDEDGVIAEGFLLVKQTASVLVVVTVTDSMRVVRVVPSVDRPTGDVVSSEPRLSFDLVDASGSLVHTCSVLDPDYTPGESIAPGSAPNQVTLARSTLSADSTVAIRLPRTTGTLTLGAYRVAPGLDISTTGGRAQRALINEITLSF